MQPADHRAYWDALATAFDEEPDHGLREGLTAEHCRELVLTARASATVRHLDDSALWGKTITDERYLVVSLT